MMMRFNKAINDIKEALKLDNNINVKNKKTFVEKFLEKYPGN